MTLIQDLGIRAEALQYLRRQLKLGKTLSKCLLESVPLTEGWFTVLSRFPLASAEIINFSSGHGQGRDGSEQPLEFSNKVYPAVLVQASDEQLAAMISSELGDCECACLIQNYLAKASDPWLATAKSLVVACGSEVYHVISRAHHGDTQSALREANRTPVLTGAVGRVAADELTRAISLRVVTPDQLGSLARTAELVFAGAYDGEGYIVWTRRLRQSRGVPGQE